MKTIVETLSKVFDVSRAPDLGPNTVLRSIRDWDSMTAVTFLVELESQTHSDLSDLDLSEIRTVGELADALAARGLSLE
jgi:acyl carrier protein